MTLGIKAVVDPLDLRGHSAAYREELRGKQVCEGPSPRGVLRKIEQLFRGAGFEKLPLVGVEFAAW